MSLRDLFPEVKHKFTPRKQIGRVKDEIKEAEEVEGTLYRKDFLYEMIDVLHAASNVLYKAGFTDEEIRDAIDFVQDKNRKRGYYGDNNRR